MTTIVGTEKALEGQKISGSSRDVVKAMGLHAHAGGLYHRYVFTKDVEAKVTEAVAGPLLFEPEAVGAVGTVLHCMKAVAHSQPKSFANEGVSARTATHQANFWRFKKQAGMRILIGHQELVEGERKRLAAAVAAKQLESEAAKKKP